MKIRNYLLIILTVILAAVFCAGCVVHTYSKSGSDTTAQKDGKKKKGKKAKPVKKVRKHKKQPEQEETVKTKGAGAKADRDPQSPPVQE